MVQHIVKLNMFAYYLEIIPVYTLSRSQPIVKLDMFANYLIWLWKAINHFIQFKKYQKFKGLRQLNSSIFPLQP